MKNIYITTPIYYVNDVAHIGHAYTTIIADSLARYHRLKGHKTFFLTGTDEHGQKIEEAAKKRNKDTKEYVDEISKTFKDLWNKLDISYDYFIRTTDETHKKTAQIAFERMYKKGDIYKGEYEGHYCVSCETFFTQNQLLDDNCCPDCGKPTRLVKEESYFFRLSAYQDKLLKWYEDDEKCVIPNGKKNEVISFVKQGLKDLSITRTSFNWGIKLPKSLNDEKHVMYVWLDALMNYLSALNYAQDDKNMHFWPASFHIVGKDILRFHAIYWPAFLMSLNLELPKRIAAHGWWTRNGEKMSKSKGNVVNPHEVIKAYGVESFRYFLLREVPFGQDGDFSQKALIDRINSDLGNELGNLLSRLIGMSEKYNNYKVSSKDVNKFHQEELDKAEIFIKEAKKAIKEIQFNKYLEEIWKILSLANQSITIYEPWKKIKESKKDEALALVGLCVNLLAKASILLYPVMPKTSEKIAKALCFKINTQSFEQYIKAKKLLNDFSILKTEQLFPRIEKELMQKVEPTAKQKNLKEESIITIEDFFKAQIKIATIISAEALEKSDRLLRLKVDLGNEQRQIIAGIKEYYKPDDLINTQICIVANLKPAKIMGELSEGMLLAAKDKDGLSLIRPESPKKNGTQIK